MIETDYRVELLNYEGPLDLLLYLIRKDEIDIYDIPILSITEQYMRYIEVLRTLDLPSAGEFIYMAAVLMHIKSRMLLPDPTKGDDDEDRDFDDPRAELVRELIEYKRFKEAAGTLGEMRDRQSKTFPRLNPRTDDYFKDSRRLAELGITDLLSAFSEVLEKYRDRKTVTVLVDEEFKVADQITLIVKLLKTCPEVPFDQIFDEKPSWLEVIATFLALLELILQKRVRAYQSKRFGKIMLKAAGTKILAET